jgi:cell division protein FtsQ
MARAAAPVFNPLPLAALPADVRLMNVVASGVFVLAGMALVAAGALWLTRAPLFTLKSIQLEGELARNGVNTVRANAMPALAGNFFSLNLQRARAAFESVPWVRKAVVRRVWPNRLAVRLEEHRPAAVWRNEGDGNERLVNSFGEVFDANLGDVEDDALPVFTGPDAASSAAMLAMYRRLAPVFARLEMNVQALQLSGRGSWRAELDSGATIELGRGTEDEVLARTERFVRTLTQATARYPQQPLQSADLRHADGYALKLRGVTTGAAPKNTPGR